MTGSMTARLIAMALLTPFWWALGLFVLAAFADAFPQWRPRLFRLFDRLGGCAETADSDTRAGRRYAA